MNSKDIVEALYQKHANQGDSFGIPSEIFIDELTTVTIPAYKENDKDPPRRIDGWAMRLLPPWRLTAYEIKISRKDFLSELRDPEKRKHALLYSNYFFFAAPKGLIEVHEVPTEAGLIEVDDMGKTKVKIRAPYRETTYPTWRFLAAVMRRIYADAYLLERRGNK